MIDHMVTRPLTLGVITARGGSKGIPGKNHKLLAGKPLIVWTIETAKRSKLITHLIVSTDDPEIAQICRKAGVDVPFMRPKELAQDDTPHVPVMRHATGYMEDRLSVRFDIVVILQPTSPFRTVEDLDGTLNKLLETDADSAVAIVEVGSSEHPVKMKKYDGTWVSAYCVEEVEGTRRQDLPKAYKRSGAVYAMKRDLVMKKGKLYGENIAAYIVARERSIDIDTPLDWVKAEYMAKQLGVNTKSDSK